MAEIIRKTSNYPWSYFRRFNPVVRIMILSDILTVMSRLGFVTPLFAVYITDRIPGGNLEVVGIASMIYLLSKSLSQIATSALIDSIRGEKDDFWAMTGGTACFSLVYLMYIFIDSVAGLYILQFFLGLAAAFLFPSWTASFSRHLDKRQEGREWGMYFTLTDLSSAAAAILSGVIAYRLGFTYLFVLAAAVSLVGTLLLLSVRKKFYKPTEP